jgi:heat-inducible transcriptional repressor
MERGIILDSGPGPGPDLTEREASVLRLVVETHIREAQPIGSHHLVRGCGLKVSAATVRGVMSTLAEKGLLDCPHASSGKEPTGAGYRYYVDHLMPSIEPSPRAQALFEEAMQRQVADRNEWLSVLAQIIGQVCRQLGIILVTHEEAWRITHIEILSLTSRRIVVVLGLEQESVRTLVVDLAKDLSADDVAKLRSVLAEWMLGRRIYEARITLENHVRPVLLRCGEDLAVVAEEMKKVLADRPASDLIVGPPGEIAMQAEFSRGERLRELLRLLQEQRPLVRSLSSPLRQGKVHVRIGEENEESELQEMSVVSCRIRGDRGLVLGLLGPKRMNYPHAIATLSWLGERLEEVV